MKPLIVRSSDFDIQCPNGDLDEIEIINELFAIHLYELHLSDEIDRNIALSDNKPFDLAYGLIYRNISEDG